MSFDIPLFARLSAVDQMEFLQEQFWMQPQEIDVSGVFTGTISLDGYLCTYSRPSVYYLQLTVDPCFGGVRPFHSFEGQERDAVRRSVRRLLDELVR